MSEEEEEEEDDDVGEFGHSTDSVLFNQNNSEKNENEGWTCHDDANTHKHTRNKNPKNHGKNQPVLLYPLIVIL
jgi:hypothetical protein